MPGFLIQNDTVCTASDETPPRVAMTTRRVSFEVALFKTGEDQRDENTGNYHNPKRQRGIFGNTVETQKINPSLTRRVGIVANSQLQNLRVGF
jgi:hypothetical protein